MATISNPLESALTLDKLKAVDVGARGGIPRHWLPFSDLIEVDALEPDEEACKKGEEAGPPNVHWFPVGLASTTGTHPLYVLNTPSGSSLYPVNEEIEGQYVNPSYWGLKEISDISCFSFSDFIETYQRPLPNVIKLDTQGSELDILSSLSEDHWSEVLCVEVEVEFLELYKGQPLFHHVHELMISKGFQLFDLRTQRMYRRKGEEPNYYMRAYLNAPFGARDLSAQLMAGEALYLRKPEEASGFSSRTMILKYLLLCQIYRFFDAAFWLLENIQQENLFDPSELKLLVQDTISKAREFRHLPDRLPVKSRGIAKRSVLSLWRMLRLGDLRRLNMDQNRYDSGNFYKTFWTYRSWPNQ